MSLESIKLSPKKNGKGYVSSYSVNISTKEAQDCNLIGKRLIKIVDRSQAEIVIKAKQYTLTIEMLQKLAELKELEKEEARQIDDLNHPGKRAWSMEELRRNFERRQQGIIKQPAHDNLEAFLLSLSMENVVDLVLMMYLGRDMDCDMNTSPGEERFLEFYDRYNYIVSGVEKDELVDIILEQEPLLMYLRMAYRLLNAPKGTPIDSFFRNWDES